MKPRYLWWKLWGRHALRRCPHSRLEGIYGDEINRVGGWRLRCVDCKRYLDGPVDLEFNRHNEWFGDSQD